jgi:hypothetical protein
MQMENLKENSRLHCTYKYMGKGKSLGSNAVWEIREMKQCLLTYLYYKARINRFGDALLLVNGSDLG